MTIQKLNQFLRAKPFRPFDIHTADGDRVTVRSPELAWLPPPGRIVYVYTGEAGPDDDVVEMIDLLLVTKLRGRQAGPSPSTPPEQEDEPQPVGQT